MIDLGELIITVQVPLESIAEQLKRIADELEKRRKTDGQGDKERAG